MRIIVILTSILVLTGNPLHAADSTADKSIGEILCDDISYVFHDAKYIGNEIINLSYSDAICAGGVLAGSALLFTLDHETRDMFQSSRSGRWDKNLEIPNEFGRIAYAEIFSGAIYLTGLFTSSEEIRTTGRLLFESLAISGIATMGFRIAFGRARPYKEEGNMEFRFFRFHEDYQSFPSGHTTVAFSVGSLLAHRINTWWSYPLFYSLASLTPICRLYYDQHWISDVFFGAAIGIIGSLVVLDAEEARLTGTKKEGKKLRLTAGPGRIGLIYQF